MYLWIAGSKRDLCLTIQHSSLYYCLSHCVKMAGTQKRNLTSPVLFCIITSQANAGVVELVDTLAWGASRQVCLCEFKSRLRHHFLCWCDESQNRPNRSNRQTPLTTSTGPTYIFLKWRTRISVWFTLIHVLCVQGQSASMLAKADWSIPSSRRSGRWGLGVVQGEL